MISVIAGTVSCLYLRGMRRYLMQFLALIAVTLMPMGMAAGPALAHDMPVTESGHCKGDEKTSDDPAKSQTHCTSCSALQPIRDEKPSAGSLPQAPRILAGSGPIFGVEPELATPPPKRS